MLVVHNTSGSDSWVMLNSMDREMIDSKKIITARGLISLTFRCGVKVVISVEVPQSVKFTCTRSHISGPLDSIGSECGLQPELLKAELSHSKITKYIYNELRHIWGP